MKTPPPQLPESPGIYQFFDYKERLLYIGKAKNIAKRISQYFSPGSLRKQEMVAEATSITYIQTPTEEDALLLEDNLIKNHLPEYNKLLRNNSNYVFLKISKDIFPSFTIVRKRINDGSTYIGPRYRSRELRQILRYLRHIFKFHTMKTSEFAKGTLSSDYFFGLDRGRSVIAQMNDPAKAHLIEQARNQGFKTEKTYEAYVEEYKQITMLVRNCFEGKTKSVLAILEQHIQDACDQQHFEWCAILRDIYRYVEALDNMYQHIILQKPLSGYFGSISQVGHYRMVILLHIVDGKVIDVIRTKKPQDEFDLTGLCASVQAEFGTTYIRQQTKNYVLFGDPALKPMSVKERTAFEQLLQTSLESFIQASSSVLEENVMHDLLIQLQQTYGLQRIPYDMECVDISHMGGDEMSGGLSCFLGGVPMKRRYRQYKITSIEKGKSDDYQALKELITRRFKLTKTSLGTELLPDLFVIDGGKGQLGILRELAQDYPSIQELMQKVDIVALGKGEARQRAGKRSGLTEILYRFDETGAILEYPLAYDHADRILVKLRDEAHRFANRYRKIQGEKKWKG